MGDPENSQYFDRLACGVAHGGSVKDVSEHIGCSVHYGYEISRTRQFRTRVSEIRTEAIGKAVAELSDAAVEAVFTLREMMAETPRDKDWLATAKTRQDAAKAILANLVPLTAQFDLRNRVEELEREAIADRALREV